MTQPTYIINYNLQAHTYPKSSFQKVYYLQAKIK